MKWRGRVNISDRFISNNWCSEIDVSNSYSTLRIFLEKSLSELPKKSKLNIHKEFKELYTYFRNTTTLKKIGTTFTLRFKKIRNITVSFITLPDSNFIKMSALIISIL